MEKHSDGVAVGFKIVLYSVLSILHCTFIMWLRVFSPDTAEVSPADLAEHLLSQGFDYEPHFKGDTHGWTTGELRPPVGSPVMLARYLTKEDDLRDDLNAYAAELETQTYSPNHGMLMEKVIQTKQMVTIRKPVAHADEAALDRLCDAVVSFLARRLGGVYQIDSRGWFTADGELLLQEY